MADTIKNKQQKKIEAKKIASENPTLTCVVKGIGAWAPGVSTWSDLSALLLNNDSLSSEFEKPKPSVIPSNEQRRAPLQVRMAVETSWQATQAAGLASEQVTCVFGSGIGDTEMTDYLCHALTTEEKQLSPTRFHNSVHNAAAGYWTISTGCMKSANSVAAYYYTAGMSLLEAIIHANLQQEPVLITLFDTQTYGLHGKLHPNQINFSVSVLLLPNLNMASSGDVVLRIAPPSPKLNSVAAPSLTNTHLKVLYDNNPAARFLPLLEQVARLQNQLTSSASVALELSDQTVLCVALERAQ